jgi:hypothetical protein
MYGSRSESSSLSSKTRFHQPNSLPWLPPLTEQITTRDGLRKLDERLVDPPTLGTVRWWHERRSTTLSA